MLNLGCFLSEYDALLRFSCPLLQTRQQSDAKAVVLKVFFVDETYISLPAKADTTSLDLVMLVCRRRNLLDTAGDFAMYVLDTSQKQGACCACVLLAASCRSSTCAAFERRLEDKEKPLELYVSTVWLSNLQSARPASLSRPLSGACRTLRARPTC